MWLSYWHEVALILHLNLNYHIEHFRLPKDLQFQLNVEYDYIEIVWSRFVLFEFINCISEVDEDIEELFGPLLDICGVLDIKELAFLISPESPYPVGEIDHLDYTHPEVGLLKVPLIDFGSQFALVLGLGHAVDGLLELANVEVLLTHDQQHSEVSVLHDVVS
jgi:hypothetical protein